MKKALIALVLLLTLCIVSASAEDAEILGQPFPDFTVTDTQGNTFTLSEVLKDHEAVLINIWATWCPPCEAEMPMLNEVYAQFFTEPFPARSAVAVKTLPKGALVEIECIAAK